MADEQKKTFPVIPATHWWTLRTRFQQSIPSIVSASFLATVLGMKENSAKANILPSLIMMGIIDQDGKPTDRAVKWREDADYPEVCREMRNELYPQELLDAVPGPSLDRSAVERWFASRTGSGQVAVKRFALVYELLTNPTIPEEKPKQKASKPEPVAMTARAKSDRPTRRATKKKEEQVVSTDIIPSIHINVQIHISSDADADQIDQIFKSMAKHLRINNDDD